MTTTSGFTNVGQTAWWRRGFFNSQAAYVSIALLIVILAMSYASSNFMTSGNISNISKNFSYVAIATLGITLVIITGGIDLSVGSVMALSATVCSMVMTSLGEAKFAPFPGCELIIAVGAGLGVAVIVGLVNGIAIAKLQLSPFVTTLGTLSIVRGVVYVASNGRGSAPDGPDADLFLTLTSGAVFGVPLPFIYLMICAIVMGVVLHHTSWGRYVFVLGGNEKAARLTGVKVDSLKIQVYVLSAVAAGFNGIIVSGWLGSAPANLASGYELKIIAAAVIGGANLAGGIGGPVGAVIGCILIEVIRNGLVLANVNAYWELTMVGAIIIAAVLVDRFRALRG